MSVTPVIGDTTAKLVISLTSGQAKSITFSSDVDLPDGTYTLTVAGADAGTVPVTQDDARTLRAVFPADNAALLWQQWRLRLDGIDFAGGPIIETQPNNPAGDSTEALTVNLGDTVVQLTVTIAGGGGGEVTADSVTTDAWTGRLSGLDQNVGAVLDMIDAGPDDHYVALFVTDDDYSGGTLTAATAYDTGNPIPRNYLVGVPVCVVSGDDMGLWTITASGPCTPGRTIDPGDVIRAFSQGFTATAGSENGVDVSGIIVAATYETVRGIGDNLVSLQGQADDLAATVGTQGTTIDTLGNRTTELESVAPADGTAIDLLTHATLVDTPTLAWATCGSNGAGHWYTDTLIPSPTTSMRIRGKARFLSTDGDNAASLFNEIYSEALDSGDPSWEAGGSWDRFELAGWWRDGRVWAFFEWTEVGGSREWEFEQDPQVDAPCAPGLPPVAWVEVEMFMDFAAGTVDLRARTDAGWDYQDADDGTKWRTLQHFVIGAPTTLAESNGVEQWIGRDAGRFDVARVRRWDDGVLVMDFDPSTATDGDTTVTDSVLVDGSSDPAVWTARYDATVVNP